MTHADKGRLILAGDIGGTKTDLALYIRGKTRPVTQVRASFPSRNALNLDTIIEKFLKKHPASIDRACLAVAGPVIDGECKTTNLPWKISERGLHERFGWPVRLINDLAAMATGIPHLYSREVYPLNEAKPQKMRNIALMAPGTGLGTSALIFHAGAYTPFASEGGHVDFAPTDEAQIRLWRYMVKRYGHVSIERIASGMGLLNIFLCINETGKHRPPPWLIRDIEEGDPARAISEAALKKGDPLCQEVLNIFNSVLGAVAGNLALTFMATGGVYLGGGIPPKILPALAEGVFMKAFTDKGRFKDLLEDIPVRVILNDRTAVLGAAHSALETGMEKDATRAPQRT